MAKTPSSLKLRNGQLKYFLKCLAARWLPPAILTRPKQGFAAPFSCWFKGEAKTYLREVLTDPSVGRRCIFWQDIVERLLS